MVATFHNSSANGLHLKITDPTTGEETIIKFDGEQAKKIEQEQTISLLGVATDAHHSFWSGGEIPGYIIGMGSLTLHNNSLNNGNVKEVLTEYLKDKNKKQKQPLIKAILNSGATNEQLQAIFTADVLRETEVIKAILENGATNEQLQAIFTADVLGVESTRTALAEVFKDASIVIGKKQPLITAILNSGAKEAELKAIFTKDVLRETEVIKAILNSGATEEQLKAIFTAEALGVESTQTALAEVFKDASIVIGKKQPLITAILNSGAKEDKLKAIFTAEACKEIYKQRNYSEKTKDFLTGQEDNAFKFLAVDEQTIKNLFNLGEKRGNFLPSATYFNSLTEENRKTLLTAIKSTQDPITPNQLAKLLEGFAKTKIHQNHKGIPTGSLELFFGEQETLKNLAKILEHSTEPGKAIDSLVKIIQNNLNRRNDSSTLVRAYNREEKDIAKDVLKKLLKLDQTTLKDKYFGDFLKYFANKQKGENTFKTTETENIEGLKKDAKSYIDARKSGITTKEEFKKFSEIKKQLEKGNSLSKKQLLLILHYPELLTKENTFLTDNLKNEITAKLKSELFSEDELKEDVNPQLSYLVLNATKFLGKDRLITEQQKEKLTAKFKYYNNNIDFISCLPIDKPKTPWKGWGFEFKENTKKERSNVKIDKGGIYVKITEIYEGSALKGMANKGDYILVGKKTDLESKGLVYIDESSSDTNKIQIVDTGKLSAFFRNQDELKVFEFKNDNFTEKASLNKEHKKVFHPQGRSYASVDSLKTQQFEQDFGKSFSKNIDIKFNNVADITASAGAGAVTSSPAATPSTDKWTKVKIGASEFCIKGEIKNVAEMAKQMQEGDLKIYGNDKKEEFNQENREKVMKQIQSAMTGKPSPSPSAGGCFPLGGGCSAGR